MIHFMDMTPAKTVKEFDKLLDYDTDTSMPSRLLFTPFSMSIALYPWHRVFCNGFETAVMYSMQMCFRAATHLISLPDTCHL
jgi:hypothetical protein